MLFDTARLLIRSISSTDAEFIFILYNSPLFVQYVGNRGITTIEDANDFVVEKQALLKNALQQGKQHGVHLLIEKKTECTVGGVSYFQRDWLPCEDIGYALLPQFQGHGYAREAVNGFIQHLQTTHRGKSISAVVAPDNLRSAQLLDAQGFSLQGEVIENESAEPLLLYILDL